MGILLLGMSCHLTKTTSWLLERKSKWMIDPLWSIKLKPYNLNVYKNLEEKWYLKQNHYTLVLETYFSLCMFSKGDVHTIKNIHLVFGDRG
jgi:hypothetical protein